VWRPVTSDVSVFSDFVAKGHQAMHPGSSSLSKIPYSGFSPVRLQTGCQPRPSPTGGRLKRQARIPRPPPDLYGATAGGSARSDPTPGRGDPRNRADAQAALLSSAASTPVQRPLARPRVMLSRRVLAYYGLM